MLVTPQQMKFLEEQTDASGVSYGAMMEQAGKALASESEKRFPEKPHILFLAGSGNNGGDCYVAGYYLHFYHYSFGLSTSHKTHMAYNSIYLHQVHIYLYMIHN